MALVAAKCTECGANITVDDCKEAGICEFCNAPFIVQKAIHNTHISKTFNVEQMVVNKTINSQNHEFDSRLAKAQDAEERYFRLGPKAVIWSYGIRQEGFNAVICYYCDAEEVGAHIPSIHIFRSRFYAKGVIQLLERGSHKLLSKKGVIEAYKETIDKGIRFSETGIEELKKEKMETVKMLEIELAKYPEKKPNSLDPSDQLYAKGCYIATSAYGSYDCPEVWVLRRYRDYKLQNTWHGRLFIKCYYAISPVLIKMFGKRRWSNDFNKKWLNKKVIKLKNKGFDDSDYYD